MEAAVPNYNACADGLLKSDSEKHAANPTPEFRDQIDHDCQPGELALVPVSAVCIASECQVP